MSRVLKITEVRGRKGFLSTDESNDFEGKKRFEVFRMLLRGVSNIVLCLSCTHAVELMFCSLDDSRP